ncbi:MAG: 2-dehydropantoate 2-reductase [Pseudomonadota bacterium]
MKIGIVGAGGIGGYLAAKLTDAGEDVAILARGAQLAAIKEGGLRLIDPDGDITVRPVISDDASILAGSDVIVIAVKAHQLHGAIEQIRDQVGPKTRVVPFQNGVDAPDILAEAFGPERAMIGTARIFANITEPGVITRYGDPKGFVFGTLGGRQSEVADILAAFRDAGIDAPDHPDVRVALWIKFIIFNAMSSLTAATGFRFGQLRKHPEVVALARRLMRETLEVGRASGAPLAEDAADEPLRLFMEVVPDEGRTSTAQDVEEGRALEIDYTCGTVARRGRELGIDVTASETIYALLSPRRDGKPG